MRTGRRTRASRCNSSSTTRRANASAPALHDQDRAKIVDVGQRGAGDDAVAQRSKEAVAIVARETVARTDAQCARARQRIRSDQRAGDLLLAIDAVGVPGDRMDAGPSIEADGEREQELDVAPAATAAADRDRRLAPGQQHARSRNRLAVDGDLARDPGHRRAHLARLALDAVAEDQRSDA